MGGALPRLLLVASLVLAACIPTVAPGATPAPSVSPGTYPAAETAFRTLLERHVEKPSSKTVLMGAVIELKRAVPALAATSRDDPNLTGDADKDYAAFKSYLDRAVAQGSKSATELERTAVVGMAKSLDDCHTYYVDPERAKNFLPAEGERYSGIGATVQNPRPNTDALPEITSVFPNSPAEKAGVRAGDKIKTVNEKNVSGLTAEEVAAMIRGPEGTEVRLLVVRPSGERAINITRASLRVPTVFEGGAEGFGVLRILQLASSVPTELASALGRLDQAGVRGWILDLRGNSGGDLTAAQLVASTFVRDGVIVYEVGRDGQEAAMRVTQKAFFQKQKPLAVLVNHGSASGAEIIAATIQDHHVGRVFGESTAGCFSSGQIRELPDGGILLVKITKMRSGVTRQDYTGKGLTPDEAIASSPDDTRDKVVDAAVAWLRTQAP